MQLLFPWGRELKFEERLVPVYAFSHKTDDVLPGTILEAGLGPNKQGQLECMHAAF